MVPLLGKKTVSEKNRTCAVPCFHTHPTWSAFDFFFPLRCVTSASCCTTQISFLFMSAYPWDPMRGIHVSPASVCLLFNHDLFKVLFLNKVDFWVSFHTRQMLTLEDCRRGRPRNASAFDKLRMRFKNPHFLQIGPCVIFPICTKVDTALPWVLSVN